LLWRKASEMDTKGRKFRRKARQLGSMMAFATGASAREHPDLQQYPHPRMQALPKPWRSITFTSKNLARSIWLNWTRLPGDYHRTNAQSKEASALSWSSKVSNNLSKPVILRV